MFSWNFREMWGAIGWLKDDLEQIEASAQAKWGKQHDSEGAHRDVTADSLTSDVHQSTTLTAPLSTVPSREVFTARVRADDRLMFDYSFGHDGLNAAIFAQNQPVATFDTGETTVLGGTTGGRFVVERASTGTAAGALTLQQADGSYYTLHVEGGKLYIVSGRAPGGGTVVGTQT